jgi:integrase
MATAFVPAPKPQRRDYYDTATGGQLAVERAPRRGQPGERPTVVDAVHALLHHHKLDWSQSTMRNAEDYLLRGRWPGYLAHEGIVYVDQLSTESFHEYMTVHADVLKPATLMKFRCYARSLAKFCKERPGFDAPLLSDGRDLPKPRIPKRKLPMALSVDDEARVVAAAKPGRDRLIAMTLLATGLRVGELCALTTDHLEGLKGRPAKLTIVGNIHNRTLTKGRRDRIVGFRDTYRNLPRDLLEWAIKERPASHLRDVFLSDADHALTTWGVEQLMQRIGKTAGVRCNPHRLRHTWATRCADAGIPMFHLQLLGGWESVEMVRRYYTASDLEAVAALARYRT